jgi:hypothetical protein
MYSQKSFDALTDEEKVTLTFGYLPPSKTYNLARNLDVDIRDLVEKPSAILEELDEDLDGKTIKQLVTSFYRENV